MDDTLENKFRLATIAPLDRRMKRKHLAVYGFLLDWYHRKYVDALASVRLIVAQLKERDPNGIGLYTGDVHSALKDLEAWGYITADVGVGRRASRYVPVWVHGSSVHKTPNTKDDEPSVRENQNTSVRETPNTTADSVHKIPNEDPLTGPGLLTEVRVSRDMFSAPATPPLADGLTATDAGSAEGEAFEKFWKIWPRKHGLKKARAAWEKITAETTAIITAASAWAEHYQKHATDKKWIAEPANWLAGERWMEDLPIIHGDAKGAAISKAKANAPMKASNDDQPDMGIPASGGPDFTVHPDQAARGTIERVEDCIDPEDGAKMLTIYYRTHRGEEIEQFFVYQSDNPKEQEDGQNDLQLLLDATELDSFEHADELVGRKVDLMINTGKFVSCSKPWVPAPKIPRPPIRFADVVKNTPLGGWCKMVGTAPMDDDDEAA